MKIWNEHNWANFTNHWLKVTNNMKTTSILRSCLTASVTNMVERSFGVKKVGGSNPVRDKSKLKNWDLLLPWLALSVYIFFEIVNRALEINKIICVSLICHRNFVKYIFIFALFKWNFNHERLPFIWYHHRGYDTHTLC